MDKSSGRKGEGDILDYDHRKKKKEARISGSQPRAARREAEWESLQDVRRVYPHADMATVASEKIVTVFNIGGNKYRLIVAMHYNRQRVYIRRFLRHAQYSKNLWKESL